MSTSIQSAFPMFFDGLGNALNDGFIYIGQPGQNPETNSKNVYFDTALSILATQPLRTSNGRILRDGVAAEAFVFTSGAYSITVRDSNGIIVDSALVKNSDLVVQYKTRADAVIDIAGGSFGPEGLVFEAGGLEYQWMYSSDPLFGTDPIADMPGVKPFGDVIYLEHFGDAGVDDLPLIQAAVAYAPAGSTISGKAQLYSSTYPVNDTVEANVVVIDTDNLTFDFHGAEFRDIVWYGKGTFGAEIDVGAGFTTGDQTINTAVAHGLAVGDHVQLLGVRNVYTTDAGEFQGGSQNPTNLDTPQCRHTEIHVVSDVPTATTATLYDAVVYPDYDNTSVGLSFPITGVDSSTIRKITPVKGIKFKGMTFSYPTQASFVGFVGRGTAGLEFEDCEFQAGDNDGYMIRATDSYKTKMVNCKEVRDFTTGTGSSYNSFVFAGGCHDIEVTGCNFKGGSQSLDFTPFHEDSEIGNETSWSGADVIGGERRYSTVQFMTVSNNIMSSCSNGFTAHPATYHLTATGNNIWGCSTGILVRSRANTITGNNIHSDDAGIVFSAFYDATVVSGNTFTTSGLSADWQGVSFVNLGSETMNNNALRSVAVVGNTIRGTSAITCDGIQFRHIGDGVPPNAGFTLFTDAIKTGLSSYFVSGNQLHECNIFVGKWQNGFKIVGNTFTGNTNRAEYIYAPTDVGAIEVSFNNFEGTDSAYTIGNDDAGLTYSFTTTSRAGLNTSRGVLATSQTNAGNIFVDHTNVLAQGGYTTEDGGSFKARRGTGAATTHIDAISQDGTSDATVKVFGPETVTTGTKTFTIDADEVDGTAVQTNTSDTDLSKLMKVGAGGLLSEGINVPGADCNLITASGFYNIGSSTANTPAGTGPSGSTLLAKVFNSDNQMQYFSERNASGDVVTFRREKRAGVWDTSWTRIYSQTDILDNVSQSAGVPTGGVIEHGSNANGFYTKFADGTLIQWTDTGPSAPCNVAEGSIFTSAPVAWTFPNFFISLEYAVSASPQSSTRWGTAYASSFTTANFRHYSGVSSASNFATRLYAIGRWF